MNNAHRQQQATREDTEDSASRYLFLSGGLEGYFDRIKSLRVVNNPDALNSSGRILEFATDLTLKQLAHSDPPAKASIVKFLHHLGLICGGLPAIPLAGANLEGIDLSGLALPGINLSGCRMKGSQMIGTDLRKTWIKPAV